MTPGGLLRRMWAAVAAGGVLIAEDADFDGWCCDPPNEAFELFLDTYRQVLAGRGGIPALGLPVASEGPSLPGGSDPTCDRSGAPQGMQLSDQRLYWSR